MKINTKTEVKNLAGIAFKADKNSNLTFGLVIAEALLNDASIPKIKAYSLAQKAYENEELDLDTADLATVKKAVDECKSYAPHTSLIFGQVLAELEK